ncbi:hypothetical protein DW861_17150 [Bacteroides uniformis]|nr:hypothetical protein DW861_17150 [Bacteroides uniformis]
MNCITRNNPSLSQSRHSSSFMRQVGLPTCHETEGVGSLIPLPTNVAGRHVRTSSKLGHDGLYKTKRKQYGKCKTGT